MINVVELTKQLIEKESITPNDSGCFALLEPLLQQQNFTIEYFNQAEVKNLFACYGDKGPLFIFLGHVDVVPTGPVDQWTSPPFIAEERDGFIYGRGSADMKSAVAAMTLALVNFVKKHGPSLNYRVGILLTSDEEGVAIDGVRAVMTIFQQRKLQIDYCLVGEPSCDQLFGDTIKIGRRGTLSGTLTILGKQGHIAYPHLADNPIHRFNEALKTLLDTQWDQGNEYFQPSCLQFSNIHAGTNANNVIPGHLTADFNFRFSTASSVEQLKTRFETILMQHNLKFNLTWHLGGNAFLTKNGLLFQATQQSIREITQIKAKSSTVGGTSDGRFIASTGAEVIEFGVINQSIHQINEHVKKDDILLLNEIYLAILEKMQKLLGTE